MTGKVKKEHQDDFIEKTRAFWGDRTGIAVSKEDAREMVANISGFFRVLAEWDKKARLEAGSRSSKAVGKEDRHEGHQGHGLTSSL
jgi:hypothetical protein